MATENQIKWFAFPYRYLRVHTENKNFIRNFTFVVYMCRPRKRIHCEATTKMHQELDVGKFMFCNDVNKINYLHLSLMQSKLEQAFFVMQQPNYFVLLNIFTAKLFWTERRDKRVKTTSFTEYMVKKISETNHDCWNYSKPQKL